RFRNERTQGYHFLKEVCRGKIVILLTATPFNNKPSDIYTLLKLFSIPLKSTIVYDENLQARFQNYSKKFQQLSFVLRNLGSNNCEKSNKAKENYEKIFPNDKSYDLKKVSNELHKIANEIRGIIEPVTIRRNRLDLKYYQQDVVDFPIVKDPIEVFFELEREQSDFYDKVIKSFLTLDEEGEFKGAIYYPENYKSKCSSVDDEDFDDEDGKDDHFVKLYQHNLYNFMRRLLVRRFESSFGAFEKSLENFINIHEIALRFISQNKIFILDRKWMEKIVNEEDSDEAVELLNKYLFALGNDNSNSKYQIVYKIDEMNGFFEDIQNDAKLFKTLKDEFTRLKQKYADPKANKLIDEIKHWLNQNRKVVIFTEYIDTAAYLEEILKQCFANGLLVAYGELSKKTIEAIYENFDAQFKNPKNQYQILLATDKLSEGFNLNRAGVVVNYDIPWNPVRVIQRFGRINRIGKKVFNEIYILNFFPTEVGADIVQSREIAQNKMFMIHKVLGEDSKIFSPDEEPQPSLLYQRLTSLPEEDENESFFSRLRKDFEKIKAETPDIENIIKNFPSRLKVAKPSDQNELFVFIQKGKDLFITHKNYAQD
ncbi:MAG: helicase-related protein, partial [Candidatus Kapaibacteriota bacterium]